MSAISICGYDFRFCYEVDNFVDAHPTSRDGSADDPAVVGAYLMTACISGVVFDLIWSVD